MKVAFLINSLGPGGAEKILVDLVNKLHEEGIDVELICIEKANTYKVNPNIPVMFLSKGMLKGYKLLNFFMMIVFAFKLKAHIDKNQIELVQSHLFRASYINLISKGLLRSEHIVQVVNHSIISRFKKEGLAGKTNLLLIKYLYGFADAILSVSRVVQSDMENMFDFKCRKSVIYNPFDIFKIKRMSNCKVDNFDFYANKKYIVSVGRLTKIKRNSDLLYALAKLNRSIDILFIGDGPEREALQLLSAKLGISSKVYFLGWVNNPYKYIKKSDLLVSTSASESFGNTIVESFVCETPVVSSSCGGPNEIIANECGLLYPVGDIDLLRSRINVALFDNDLREKLIKKASLRALEFSLPKIMDKYKHLLMLNYKL